jgi:acyl-CoA dehydrogenase
VDSNQLFIDGLRIPWRTASARKARASSYILHGMNPERILIAAEAVGLGRAALARAAGYAAEREVFGRPIGQNQGIQHPLAEAGWTWKRRTSWCMKAAWLYDRGKPCGAEANAAKFLGAEAGYRACERAIFTHGGMGYAKEYHVERYLRES